SPISRSTPPRWRTPSWRSPATGRAPEAKGGSMTSLTMTYTRRNLAETIRTPTMFLTVALVPVGVMVFFVVPFIGQDVAAITSATATLVVFGVLMACIGHFSVAIAAQREST